MCVGKEDGETNPERATKACVVGSNDRIIQKYCQYRNTISVLFCFRTEPGRMDIGYNSNTNFCCEISKGSVIDLTLRPRLAQDKLVEALMLNVAMHDCFAVNFSICMRPVSVAVGAHVLFRLTLLSSVLLRLLSSSVLLRLFLSTFFILLFDCTKIQLCSRNLIP